MSQLALRDPQEVRTSINDVRFASDAGGSHLTPQNLGDIVRFADVMSKADIAIPKHLRGNPGACLAVCMQAMKWEMDPFSVAQKSYKVGDQMAYEAQLIAAVINTRAGLRRRPQIDYQGEDNDRKCIVTFEALDGSVHVYESPRFGAITTKNSPLWKSDPDQQLGYYSIRAGARRHFPEVILGVYDRDELEAARDVTPARTPLQERFAARPQEAHMQHEGFGHELVSERAQERHKPQTETGEAENLSTNGSHISGDPGDDLPDDSGDKTIDPDAPASQHELAIDGEAEQRQAEETKGQPNHDPALRNLLTECAAKFLELAVGKGEPKDRQDAIKAAIGPWKAELPNNLDDVRKIVDRANAIVTGKLNLPAAVTMLATELALKEADIRPAVR